MAFEARYKKGKLIGLACIGLGFVAVGLWMASQPDGSFDNSRKIRALAVLFDGDTDLIGHGIGWFGVLLGMGFMPLIAKQFRLEGAAIRVDEAGIYWHRWSPKPIGWDNIAAIEPGGVFNQKFLTLTLHDPSLDPSTGLLGKAAKLNSKIGFGQVSILVQGTDASFEELVEAVFHFADLHQANLQQAA